MQISFGSLFDLQSIENGKNEKSIMFDSKQVMILHCGRLTWMILYKVCLYFNFFIYVLTIWKRDLIISKGDCSAYVTELKGTWAKGFCK